MIIIMKENICDKLNCNRINRKCTIAHTFICQNSTQKENNNKVFQVLCVFVNLFDDDHFKRHMPTLPPHTMSKYIQILAIRCLYGFPIVIHMCRRGVIVTYGPIRSMRFCVILDTLVCMIIING